MKVRTTINPDIEVEVDEAERLDLQRAGILLDPPAAEPGKPSPASARANKTEKEGN